MHRKNTVEDGPEGRFDRQAENRRLAHECLTRSRGSSGRTAQEGTSTPGAEREGRGGGEGDGGRKEMCRTCFSKVCWAASASGGSVIIEPRLVENASSHPSMKPAVDDDPASAAASVFGDWPRTQTSLVCFASLISWNTHTFEVSVNPKKQNAIHEEYQRILYLVRTYHPALERKPRHTRLPLTTPQPAD